MWSFQRIRPYAVFLLFLHLTHTLTAQQLPQGGCAWLIGYKVILVAASLRAAASYTRMKLNALVEKVRRTQLLVLSTTGRSEALALHREKRLSQVPAGLEGSRYSKRSFGQLEEIPFHLYDRYTEAPARGARRRPKRDGFCAATRQGRGKGTRSRRFGLIHRELPVSWRRGGPMRAGDPERLAVAGKAVFPHQHATGLAEMEPIDRRLHWWTDLSAASKTCLVGGRAPGSSHERRPIADADTRRRRRERPGFPAGDATYPRWWLALAFGGQGGRTESSSGPSVSPPPTDQGGSSVRAANAPSPWPPARPSTENRGSTERPAEVASVEGLARLAQGDFAFKTKVRGAHEGQLVNKFPKPAKKHGTPYEILEQHKKRNKTKQDRVLDVPLSQRGLGLGRGEAYEFLQREFVPRCVAALHLDLFQRILLA
ncbi:hypothetical protein Q5P01_016605 [Channa striata]|uniref:Uncharacterized protein n=1 Tax=Channa striata TaxID=64152 RepID=A0AA88SCN0_CHASR|nr:hypothetical protein Q5P01_016605 [Channa striata]